MSDDNQPSVMEEVDVEGEDNLTVEKNSNQSNSCSEAPNVFQKEVSMSTQGYSNSATNGRNKSNDYSRENRNSADLGAAVGKAYTISAGSNSINNIPVACTSITLQSNSSLNQIKAWSVNKLMCTKQLLSERLGKATITVDPELDDMIAMTRDAHQRIMLMLEQATKMSEGLVAFVESQRALAGSFAEMSQKLPELNAELDCSASTQKIISRRGDILIGDLNFFTSNISTLCTKTIDDTLQTIKQYETARLEYDAHRNSYEEASKNPQKADEAKRQFDIHREKFEQLRGDAHVKVKLLNQNKLKVMRKQLFLLNAAVVAYYTEDHEALIDSRQKFNTIKSSASTPALFDD